VVAQQAVAAAANAAHLPKVTAGSAQPLTMLLSCGVCTKKGGELTLLALLLMIKSLLLL